MRSFLFDVDYVYCKNGNICFLLDTTSYQYENQLYRFNEQMHYIEKTYTSSIDPQKWQKIETNISIEEYHELERKQIDVLLKIKKEKMLRKWELNKIMEEGDPNTEPSMELAALC